MPTASRSSVRQGPRLRALGLALAAAAVLVYGLVGLWAQHQPEPPEAFSQASETLAEPGWPQDIDRSAGLHRWPADDARESEQATRGIRPPRILDGSAEGPAASLDLPPNDRAGSRALVSAPSDDGAVGDAEGLVSPSPVPPLRPSWSHGPPWQVGETLDADDPGGCSQGAQGDDAVQLGPLLDADDPQGWQRAAEVYGSPRDLGPRLNAGSGDS